MKIRGTTIVLLLRVLEVYLRGIFMRNVQGTLSTGRPQHVLHDVVHKETESCGCNFWVAEMHSEVEGGSIHACWWKAPLLDFFWTAEHRLSLQ